MCVGAEETPPVVFCGVVGVASWANGHSDGETCVEFFGIYVLFIGKPFDCLSEVVRAGKGDQAVGGLG